MTENLKKAVISLVSAALGGEAKPLPEDLDFEGLYQFAVAQNIVPLVYYGLVNTGVDQKNPFLTKFFLTTCQYIAISEKQNEQMSRIFSAFEENKIEYLPLKGTRLRALYPKGEMRPMGDLDILIKEDQYEKISPLMEGLGFTFEKESNHEFIWYSGKVCIELHKYLIPSYNKDYYSYFGSGWERAKKLQDQSCFEMRVEDELIYLITHFAKHYRDGGIGIKHLLDLKQFLEQKNIDEAYLSQQMKSLCLWDFFTHIKDLIAFWFYGAREDAAVLQMEKVLFAGGAFGTEDAHQISAAVKEGIAGIDQSRKQRVISSLFLSYPRMCQLFPVLKKAPFLLPVFWIWRIVKTALFKKSALSKNYQRVKNLSSDNISQYEKDLALVGLEYRLKEE